MIDLTRVDTICFDMDGTIADLYNYENWLSYFQNEKSIFHKLPPMVDPAKINVLLTALKNFYDLRVITWLPMNATKEYKKICSNDKKVWVREHFAPIKKIHTIQYGAVKHYVSKLSKHALIFDDNKEVRERWEKSGRIACDETEITEVLLKLLEIKVRG